MRINAFMANRCDSGRRCFVSAPVVFSDKVALSLASESSMAWLALRHGFIVLLQRVAGVGQVQGEVSIVGQQKQAAGIVVQAAHGIDALPAQVAWEQIEYGLATQGIRDRR